MKNKLLISILTIFLLTTVSCGGSGSDGDGSSTGVTYTIIYTDPTPGTPVAGDIVIAINDAESSGNNLVFDIIAYGALTSVYDIAFHLCYDETILQFISASDTGSILDDNCNGGNCLNLTADSTTVTDKVIIGLTRQDPGIGVDLPTGTNHIMKLEFKAIAKGTTTFDFTCGAGALEDIIGTDISNLWYGGDVSVN